MSIFSYAIESLNEKNKIQFIYHYIKLNDISTIKKMGIGSPRYLYDNYPDIFKQTSFEIYKERAKRFLNKNKIEPKDVITFLDSRYENGKLLSSKSIFFLFFPITEFVDINIKKIFNNSIECKIPINLFLSKTPILLNGPKVFKSSWNIITNKPFYRDRIKELNILQKNYAFSKIQHLALDIYHININDQIKLTKINT